MKHLLIVTTSYPLTRDGSEAAGSFVADFSETLAKYLQVTVVAPAMKTGIEHVTPSLWVRYFAVPTLPLSLLNPLHPGHWTAIWQTLKAGGKSVRQVVEVSTVDHILALWVLPSGYWAKRLGETHGIPYSTWALGSDIWSLGKLPLARYMLKQVLQSAQSNFADGYQLKQAVETLSEKPCEFLPSTRHLPLLTPKQLSTAPPYRLAFLGRWHPNKGIDILLESLSLLPEEAWANIAEIRIAGGGPLEPTVRKAQAKLQAAGRTVTCLGYLQKQEAAALFTWADYVLIPSRIESIPVVFSDAMQCGCPVVAMPVGDLPRLLSAYQVGVMAVVVTPMAFADALTRVVGQAPAQFEAGMRSAAQAFDMRVAVNRFREYVCGK